MGRVPSEKKVRFYLRQQVNLGRMALLVMVGVTLVNQLLLALKVNYHFLLSAAVPYYLNWTCQELGLYGSAPALAAVLTVGLYVVYLACWFLSRRRRGWLLAALGLYAVDTLLLVIFAATMLKNAASCTLEILAHMGILTLLTAADQAAGRLDRMRTIRRTQQKEGTYDKLQYHRGQAVPTVPGKSDQNRPV